MLASWNDEQNGNGVGTLGKKKVNEDSRNPFGTVITKSVRATLLIFANTNYAGGIKDNSIPSAVFGQIQVS